MDTARVTCWCCADGLTEGGPVVGDVPLPVCDACWESLTEESRLAFAMQYLDRQPGGIAWSIGRMADAIFDRLEAPGGFGDFKPGRN